MQEHHPGISKHVLKTHTWMKKKKIDQRKIWEKKESKMMKMRKCRVEGELIQWEDIDLGQGKTVTGVRKLGEWEKGRQNGEEGDHFLYSCTRYVHLKPTFPLHTQKKKKTRKKYNKNIWNWVELFFSWIQKGKIDKDIVLLFIFFPRSLIFRNFKE